MQFGRAGRDLCECCVACGLPVWPFTNDLGMLEGVEVAGVLLAVGHRVGIESNGEKSTHESKSSWGRW